jgi:hypothetical protein
MVIKETKVVELIALFIIYAFLPNYLKPELIFLKITTLGGDTTSHH